MNDIEQRCQIIAEKLYCAFIAEVDGVPETEWQYLAVRVMRRFMMGVELSLWTSLQLNSVEKKKQLKAPPPQCRWTDTCPRCGHVHSGDGECGTFMGRSAGHCQCQEKVTA